MRGKVVNVLKDCDACSRYGSKAISPEQDVQAMRLRSSALETLDELQGQEGLDPDIARVYDVMAEACLGCNTRFPEMREKYFTLMRK